MFAGVTVSACVGKCKFGPGKQGNTGPDTEMQDPGPNIACATSFSHGQEHGHSQLGRTSHITSIQVSQSPHVVQPLHPPSSVRFPVSMLPIAGQPAVPLEGPHQRPCCPLSTKPKFSVCKFCFSLRPGVLSLATQ